jgi:hypothetical protein
VAFVLIAAAALLATAGAVRMHPEAGASVTRRSSGQAAAT